MALSPFWRREQRVSCYRLSSRATVECGHRFDPSEGSFEPSFFFFFLFLRSYDIEFSYTCCNLCSKMRRLHEAPTSALSIISAVFSPLHDVMSRPQNKQQASKQTFPAEWQQEQTTYL